MSNGRLIDTTPSVDVDCVDNFIRGLCLFVKLVLVLVLPRGCQQQAAIWGERKSSEEGSQGLIGVETSILHAEACGSAGFGRWIH